jgi:hypothetical protein
MESRGNIEKPEAEIAIRGVAEQKHSTTPREFFTRGPGVAAVTSASAAVPVISPTAEPKGFPGAANKRAAIRGAPSHT